MATKRTSREAEETHLDREDLSREDIWEPPALLEAPPARPGMRQRWVSTSILGKDVPQHAARRFREGWTPRPANTVPNDFYVPTIAHGQFEGVVGVEGMILCEMPEERAQARDRYFRGKTSDQQRFVNQALDKVAQSGGVEIDKTSKEGIDRGSRPSVVMEDDE